MIGWRQNPRPWQTSRAQLAADDMLQNLSDQAASHAQPAALHVPCDEQSIPSPQSHGSVQWRPPNHLSQAQPSAVHLPWPPQLEFEPQSHGVSHLWPFHSVEQAQVRINAEPTQVPRDEHFFFEHHKSSGTSHVGPSQPFGQRQPAAATPWRVVVRAHSPPLRHCAGHTASAQNPLPHPCMQVHMPPSQRPWPLQRPAGPQLSTAHSAPRQPLAHSHPSTPH